jgi:hypothetical protein
MRGAAMRGPDDLIRRVGDPPALCGNYRSEIGVSCGIKRGCTIRTPRSPPQLLVQILFEVEQLNF